MPWWLTHDCHNSFLLLINQINWGFGKQNMKQTVLCTTGTSIANGCPALRDLQKNSRPWDAAVPDLEAEIVGRLRNFDLGRAEDRHRASAELHSLERLGLNPGDSVVLLATDTADGRACAEATRDCLAEHFGLQLADLKVDRVEGLQVRDAVALRRQGLVNLTDAVLRYIDDPQVRYGSELILNPTGGYKGIVPFLTILGMLFRLRSVYVFEHANALIQLPPLPVTFDLPLYERALPAIEKVLEEGALPELEFFARVEGFQEHERELLGGFLESDGGLVTLSPLAMVLARLDRTGARTIYLSPKVRETLDGVTGSQRIVAERLLARVAHPLWRSIHRHRIAGTDLEVFKPGNVAERVACIVSRERVDVCALYLSHDQYERGVSARRRSEFNPETFTSWEVPALDDLEQNLREVRGDELDQAREKIRRLQEQLKEARQPYREELKTFRSAAAEANRLRAQNGRLEMEAEGVRRELDRLQAKGGGESRPASQESPPE